LHIIALVLPYLQCNSLQISLQIIKNYFFAFFVDCYFNLLIYCKFSTVFSFPPKMACILLRVSNAQNSLPYLRLRKKPYWTLGLNNNYVVLGEVCS